MNNSISAAGGTPRRPASAPDFSGREPAGVRPDHASDLWPFFDPAPDPELDIDLDGFVFDPLPVLPPCEIVVTVGQGPDRRVYFGRRIGTILGHGRYEGGWWDLTECDAAADAPALVVTDLGPELGGACTCAEFERDWDCAHLAALAAAGFASFGPWYTPRNAAGGQL